MSASRILIAGLLRSLESHAARLALRVLLIALAARPATGQTLVGTIHRPGMMPTAVAVYEAGNKVFVADDSTGNLYMYDGTTLAELSSVNVGTVWGIVVDEAYGKLYANIPTTPLGYNGKLVEVNAATGAFIGQFELAPDGILTYPLAYDPGLAKVYVLSGGFDTNLIQIDIATDTTASVPLPSANYALAALEVNPVTHEVFIGITGYGLPLQIINGITLAKTTGPDDGSFSGGFWGLGVNSIENKLYRADASGGPYTLYDRDTGSVSNIGANNDATVFVFNPTSNRVYTDSEVDGFATIMDGATDAFLNIGMYGVSLGVRRSTNHVYYEWSFIAVLDDATQLVEAIPTIDPPPDCAPPSGGTYSAVAVNQATGRVFAMNSCFVTVLQDTKELTRPPVYVAAVYSGPESFALHILDPVSKTVVSSPLSYAEYGLAVRPGGGRIYEATYDHFSLNGSIRIHAGIGDRTLLATFEDGGIHPTIPVVTPDGNRLYVTNSGSADVSVVNTADNSVVTTIPVGTTGSIPWGAAVTPDGAKVYVANRGNHTVHVISTASNSVNTTLPVGTAPWAVAINPAGTKAYVVNSGSNSVSVIDTASDTVISTVYVGTTPHWLAVSPDGGRVYVTNNGAGTVSVIETGTDTIIQTVTVGDHPEGVAVMPDGSEVYVVNFNASAASWLSVISPLDYKVNPMSLPTDSRGAIPIAVADPTSKFAGRVTKDGAAMANALVRAIQGEVQKGTATTNAAGDYSIFNLKAGTYDIEFSAHGCDVHTLPAQSVGLGRTTVLNSEFTSGECSNPEVQLSSAGLSFGIQALVTPSLSQSVVLTNAGFATLHVSSFAIGEAHAADFSLTHTCGGGDIAPAGQCSIAVTFTPSAAGPRKSALTITSNASGSPHHVILTGVGSALGASPTTLGFADRQVGTTSPAATVTLTNLIASPLHVWTSAVAGGNSGDFARVNSCPIPPATLAGRATCAIKVTFTPSASGARSASLLVSHDGGGSPQSVLLTGTGLGAARPDVAVSGDRPAASPTTAAPAVAGARGTSLGHSSTVAVRASVKLSASSVNFGSRPVGFAAPAQEVELTNASNARLTISSFEVSGRGGDFMQTNTCGSSLPPRSKCTIRLSFIPQAVGNRSGTISVFDDAPGSPHQLQAKGVGTGLPARAKPSKSRTVD